MRKIKRHSNFKNKYLNFISSRFLNITSFGNAFFGNFCQQYITELQEMRNESQYCLCPTLTLITAQCISCTLNDTCQRNTSPNPQEGCAEFSCNCQPCLVFAKPSLNLTHRCSIGFKSGLRTGHGINSYVFIFFGLEKVPCGSFCMNMSVVVLKSAVPMTINKWHHMGSQNLIHVASGYNSITSASADV